MVNRHSHGQGIEEARFFGTAREPVQFLTVHKRRANPRLAVVVEEDEVDDLIIRRGETEGDVREAEESFDIRDLLLDETD